MTITLPPHLEAALVAQARERGVAPEVLAIELLRRHLLPLSPPTPTDEWERRLFSAATDCGVSLSNEALSSDGLYE